MKDIYRFTNNLHIFTLEVFILLKAQPVFTCWFLPVDQRQTHTMIKTAVQRQTLAAPRLLFERFLSEFNESSFRRQTLRMTVPA